MTGGTGPTGGARPPGAPGRAAPDGAPSDGPASEGAAPAGPWPRRSRGRRRAVRAGAGDPDASVGLRAHDDRDVGWQPPAAEDSDDDRLRREVPPHW